MRYLTLLPLLCLVAACAVPPSPVSRQPESGQPLQLQQLQTRQDELTRQLTELQESLHQLEVRMQAQQAILARLPQGAATPQIVTPDSQTTGATQGSTPPMLQASLRPGGPTATELYLKSFSDYASGRFNEAADGFRSFLDRYPDNDFAGNAQFWLGECYYSQRLLTRSAHEFELVAENYPEAAKAADALARMSEIYRELKQDALAEQVERRLLDNYPQSPAARKLQARP